MLFAAAWVTTANLQGVLPADTSLLLARFGFVSSVIMALGMAQFATLVSESDRKLWLSICEYLYVAVSVVLSMTPFVLSEAATSGRVFAPVRGPAYLFVVSFVMYGSIKASILLFRAYQQSMGKRRVRYAVMAWGIVAGTTVGIFTNVILPNIVHNTYPSRYAFVAILIWTFSLGYGIWRYRILDIRWATAKAVAYSLTFAFVIASYTFVVVVLGSYVCQNYSTTMQQAYYLFASLVAAVMYLPLKRYFNELTNRYFFHTNYSLGRVLDNLGDQLAETIDIRLIVDRTAAVVAEAIHPGSFRVLLIDKENGNQLINVVSDATIDAKAIASLLARHREKIVVSDLFDQEPSTLQQQLTEAGVAAAVTLQTPKGIIGYMLVGHKHSGYVLSRQDIDLLGIISDQLALAIENGQRFVEIKQLNESLQSKIEEATKELRESNSKLMKLDKAKDEFISMASHQLRTPLTSIKGYLSMVLEGDSGSISSAQKKLIEEAFNSTQRMVYLVGDFLNVSRIQTGRFIIERTPVDLVQVVEDEISQVAATATRRQITINKQFDDALPMVQMDEPKMRQVIMNFLDNAIYYSKQGGEVLVQINADEHNVSLKVTDKGIGVPPNERKNIFTRFYRATNAKNVRPDGTGIGLFMAKKVITSHGGELIFESTNGKGSTFGFSLPLNVETKK